MCDDDPRTCLLRTPEICFFTYLCYALLKSEQMGQDFVLAFSSREPFFVFYIFVV